jgi:hypothetical protein
MANNNQNNIVYDDTVALSISPYITNDYLSSRNSQNY